MAKADIKKEVQGLLDDLAKGYSKLRENNPFQDFKDFTENGAAQLREALKSVNDQVYRLGDTIDDVVKEFKDLVEDIQKIDMSVQKQIRWFKKTNDLLSEAKQILKGNRDATADQLRSVSDQLKYRYKEKGILAEHQDQLKKINKEVKEREKEERKIIHAYGIMGNAVEALNKELPGPLAKFMDLDGAAKKMKEVAEAGGNAFDVIKEGGKSVGRSLKKSFLDPANAVNLIVAAFKFAYEAALNVDKQLVDISKNMGVTYEGAEILRDRMKEIRDTSGDIYYNVRNQVEAQNQLNASIGTAGMFSDEMVKGQINLTKKMGIQGEEAAKLSTLFAVNNQSQKEGVLLIAKQVTNLSKQKGIMLSMKDVTADVAKVQGQLRLQYGNSTEQIAKAVVLSKTLGMTIEQSNSAAKKLLDFESSIANELEAELLTGKELNLEEARSLALAGKTAEAQALVMKEVGGINDFMGRTVFEQESLAQAAGMTVDEFSNALIQQDNLNKLGTQQRDNLLQMVEDLKAKGEVEAANQLLAAAGDEAALAAAMERTDIQADFNELILDVKEAVGDLLEGPMRGMLLSLKEFLSDGDKVRGLFETIKIVVSAIGGLIVGRMAYGLAQGVASLMLQNAQLAAQRGLMSAIIAQKSAESAVETTKAAAAVTAAEASTMGAATPFIIGGIAAVMGALAMYALADGAIDPNGGLVISKPAGDMLVPVAQGIKGDYAYLSTNSPQQTQGATAAPMSAGAVAAPASNNNPELLMALQAIAANTAASARKEFDFDTFGTTTATKSVGISA
jgi:hypothetical protein